MEKQIEQKKKTELEEHLAKRLSILEKNILNHPAYARRKKDEKNWQTFFTIFGFTALAGIFVFGTFGWWAVALIGTSLSIFIVEAGLYSSLAIGFSAWPLYNIYIGIRDLFAPEKVKIQNKDYNNIKKNLIELKELAAKKKYLSEKINLNLYNALKYFPSGLSAQENTSFVQLDLNEQIRQLVQENKKNPAYSRKQKDKHNWSQIFRYSAMTSFVGLGLYAITFIMMMGAPAAILLGPIFPVLVVIEAIVALLIVGPITVSSALYATYLGMRDLLSSAEIKAENKQYVYLEKTIAELTKLDKQLSQLDALVNSKLQEPTDVSLASIHITNEKENNGNLPKKYAYKVFQKNYPNDPANQARVEPTSTCNKSM